MSLNVDYYLRSSCCCPPSSQPVSQVQAAQTPISMERIVGWINRANTEIPRADALNANGLYSLLNQEVTVITDLLAESNSLVASINSLTPDFIRRTVDTLVRPKKEQLERALATAQQKVTEHHAEIETDHKLSEKWATLGLPASVLERHADCARFMIESGLAFAIVGYRETSQNPAMHDLRLAPDGHPLIKVQNQWVRWERLKEQVAYDPDTYMIRSRDYPGQLVQAWTYLSPQGLMPIDRMNHDRLVPVYQLSPEEYQRTLQTARRFYETNAEVDVGVAKDCVIQFVTSPSRRLCATKTVEDTPANQNLIENINSHVIMRLITPNGDVYSFGLEMPAESQEFLFHGGSMDRFMATVPAKVNKAGDYEEFRQFDERIVTGIPLTQARANGIIQMMNNMGDIQFQFMRQNCSNLMRTVIQEAGYDPIDNRINGGSVLFGVIPNGEHWPVIGPVIGLVKYVTTPVFNFLSNWTPEFVKSALSFVWTVITYIPHKIGIVLVNLIQLKLGGGKMLYPLPEGVQEDEFYDNRRIINFSRNIRSFWDMFRDETTVAYHSKHVIDWQKQQRSTFSEQYSGRPKLVVVPPVATTV
ncbi:MAG: hypothetical protein JSR57_02560 [Verrucomicrobia bacterium]|nr:hypothetical protein [Verrucomicrobiota bacterium]